MLTDLDAVDGVMQRPDGTWEITAKVGPGEWMDEHALFWLREKMDTLSIYAIDGEMERAHPGSKRQPVVLVLESVDPCPLDALQLLLDMKAAVEMDDVLQMSLQVRQSPQRAAA